MVTDRLLEAVKITKIDHGCSPDYETEYWMDFRVEGTIGEIKFALGEGDQDKYICGARKFDNEDEVLAEIAGTERISFENFNPQTAADLANQLAILSGNPAKAKMYMDRLFSNEQRMKQYIRAIVVRKIAREYKTELTHYMHECNDCADEMNKSWKKEYDGDY